MEPFFVNMLAVKSNFFLVLVYPCSLGIQSD